MSDYGPDDRALFEAEAIGVYEEAVQEAALAADDPRFAEDGPQRPALDLLVRMNLLTRDPGAKTWIPIDPTTAQSQVVAPLGQQGAALLNESSQWARAFGSLTQAWRRAPHTDHGPFTQFNGGESISAFIGAAVAEADEELLTAQPQGIRDGRTIDEATQRDIAALERGVKMRSLYQHSARRSAFTTKYVAAVSERGGEVRTLDEFFNRIIVIDRRLAIIPGREALTSAIAIREPNIVAYFVDLFERTWERARPFTHQGAATQKDIAQEQRAMTIRMLIEGHPDPNSAKRLGVSPRTFAGYVADLKAEYEAETRFQLGYTMGSQGVSGNETPDNPM